MPLFLFLIVISVIIFFFHKEKENITKELIGALVGTMVGVLIGFIAQPISDSIKHHREKAVYLTLLKEDAKNAYQNVWVYQQVINSPTAPPGFIENFKRGIPAEFNLNYWNVLSKDKDFLKLANEEPFKEIFETMFILFNVNELTQKAAAGDGSSAQFVRAIYDQAIVKENMTKRLLLKFMSEDEITSLELDWKNSYHTAKK